MKRINIYLESGKDLNLFKKYIEKVYSLFLNEPFLITAEYCCDKLNNYQLQIFLKWIIRFHANFSKTNIKCIIIPTFIVSHRQITCATTKIIEKSNDEVRVIIKEDGVIKSLKKPIELLCNKDVHMSLEINNTLIEDVEIIYKRFSLLKVDLYIPNYKYQSDLLNSFFDKWCYDFNGSDINIFSDIVSMILLGINHNDCSHNSCLGSNICIDESGAVFFCKYNRINSQVGTIDSAQCIDDIFENPSFINLIRKSIEKREACRKGCTSYDVCGGGCPLQSLSYCQDKKYIDLYSHAEELVKKIMHTEDYFHINPSLRKIFLSAISRGKGMFISKA